jgi:hypothetical protein
MITLVMIKSRVKNARANRLYGLHCLVHHTRIMCCPNLRFFFVTQYDEVRELHRTMITLCDEYSNLEDVSNRVEITRAGAMYGEEDELYRQVD